MGAGLGQQLHSCLKYSSGIAIKLRLGQAIARILHPTERDNDTREPSSEIGRDVSVINRTFLLLCGAPL